MAKYNLSRYNTAKYNRSVSAGIIYDEFEAGALLTAFIGLGQVTKDSLNAQSRFTAEAKMASGSLEQTTWTAAFTPAITGISITWGKGTLASEFASSDCALSPLVKDSTSWTEDFAGDIYLGPKVRDTGLSMKEEIGCDTYLGYQLKDPDGINGYALFNAVVDAESYEEIIMDLDVTIPAGSVLTIDSDNFRVLLDGVNAIKYHSGDWIDQMNRTSESITIQSSGTGLTASIYYQELWL